MEILGKLFGSEARVRILRLFFLNPDMSFDPRDVSQKTKTNPAMARKELAILQSSGIIRHNRFHKGNHGKRKRVVGWCFDNSFLYREQLKNLLVGTDLVKKNDILKRFLRAGKIKLLIIAGIFTKDESSRVDVFIVGDNLKRSIIEKILRGLEAEVGKEIRYAILETPDFLYRMEMYDKFVRDILEYPHETIVDRLGVENP